LFVQFTGSLGKHQTCTGRAETAGSVRVSIAQKNKRRFAGSAVFDASGAAGIAGAVVAISALKSI
jgi:hypothetical protein